MSNNCLLTFCWTLSDLHTLVQPFPLWDALHPIVGNPQVIDSWPTSKAYCRSQFGQHLIVYYRKCCPCILSTLKKGPFFGSPLLASSTNIRLPGRAQVRRPHILYAPWNLIPETDAGNFSLAPTKFEALWKVLLNWSSLESRNFQGPLFLYFLFMPAGSGAGDESKLLRKCSTFNSSVLNVEHNETT